MKGVMNCISGNQTVGEVFYVHCYEWKSEITHMTSVNEIIAQGNSHQRILWPVGGGPMGKCHGGHTPDSRDPSQLHIQRSRDTCAYGRDAAAATPPPKRFCQMVSLCLTISWPRSNSQPHWEHSEVASQIPRLGINRPNPECVEHL